MLRNIVAIERDGLDFRVLTILFEVPDEKFDIEEAARKAATEFCLTENGREIYDYNCSSFNWADFEMNVPNSICEKYGFRKVNEGILSDIVVDWNEELVSDSEIDETKDDSFVISVQCPICGHHLAGHGTRDSMIIEAYCPLCDNNFTFG